ncbi:Meckel syndrome type 1 protein-like isoform X2 [Zootermopsis nevadensis]|uniref:Meckel syndrome type 1 protein-like isoform X2 n=1 Tax=Zootermopsis nevadensis TaxID=136037 RepID=UPI000B8EDE80|nr:Meckel syndrome type 1 protein-like isoform X2 [Zootermopsis nevadensis]
MFYKDKSDYVTGVYRCKDCIKNFKIRVRLQHDKSMLIPLPQFQQDESHVQSTPHISTEGLQETEEKTFSWQEKVFSPFEISYYQYAGNCHTALEERYHKDVIRLCQENTPNNRLFTYTDADDFTDMEETNQSVTTDSKPLVTSLVEGMSELRHRQKFGHRKSHRKDMYFSRRNIVEYNPNMELKKKNHFLQTSLQTFYILADLSVKNSDENWVGKSEYVLCTIRWDSIAGLLMVTPDFTSIASSAEHVSRLDPYRIEVDGDARNTYHYWIEHASTDMSQEEKDKEFAVINKLYEHHSDIRQMKVGSEFKMPRHGILQVHILGEVSSAKQFEYDHLFVHYFFELPKGWSCENTKQLSGFTQTCSTQRTGIANFSYLFELQLSLNLEVLQGETEILLSWPQMFVEVVSNDSWNRCRNEGYGYVSLPPSPGMHTITVSTWRPLSASPIGEMRRFFIGGSPQLEDPSFVGIPSNFKEHWSDTQGYPHLIRFATHLPV